MVGVDDAVEDQFDAVAADLGAAGGQQLGRGRPVAGEEALHVRGGGVAWLAGVDDDHAPAGASEHERRAQAGGAAADDRDVVGVSVGVHGPQRAPLTPGFEGFVAVSGKRR